MTPTSSDRGRGGTPVCGGGVRTGRHPRPTPNRRERSVVSAGSVPPHAARQVPGAVHLEGVQVDLLGDQRLPACSLIRLIRL
jgi:hypothetical protein